LSLQAAADGGRNQEKTMRSAFRSVRRVGVLVLCTGLGGTTLMSAHAMTTVNVPVQAATTAATAAGTVANAASAPSSKQLAALCATCAIVQGTAMERRKGEATAVGTAGGAVVGGVVGSKVGDGGVLATGAGAVAGGLLGREIEKQVKRYKVWVTTVTTPDGKSQKFEARADPGFQPGEVVRIDKGALVKAAAAIK
jgi:outer membrane lipoprotein SlyB